MNTPFPGRASLSSIPEVAELAAMVSRVHKVQIPRMKDQRSVTRRLLDELAERVSIHSPSLSDSRG